VKLRWTRLARADINIAYYYVAVMVQPRPINFSSAYSKQQQSWFNIRWRGARAGFPVLASSWSQVHFGSFRTGCGAAASTYWR
jgi:hypothetical protein